LKFNKEHLLNLIGESLNLETIDISAIPDIDLYMDQVTTFMEDKLEKFKRTEEDKILTKTMINNYTKNEIIPSPKKKKYSKEHMMLLILTYHMKQTLSMGDIHSLLSPISENDDVETLYKNFLEIQLKEYNEFPKEILKKVDELETQISSHEDESNHLMIYSIIFFLIIQASMQKKLAETLIDNFFIDKKSDKS